MLPEPDIASHPEAAIADKRFRLARLRGQLAELERHGRHGRHGVGVCLPLGPGEMHAHLPAPGLAGGVLHEIAGAMQADQPAAFGFVVALMAVAARADRAAPAFLVASRRALAPLGRPYGRGLGQAGLEPDRLILVETRSDKDALWALEEVLTSDARPAVVAGAVAAPLGLTESRRLNLAAARHGTPLLALSPSGAATSAAATRWRIAAAPAGRDRFGMLAHPRWRIVLERCRHGRPGEWLVEWDHAAYRFRLAQGLADRAPASGAACRRRAAG